MTINSRGKLIDVSSPRVMGIINLTPDSFYSGSRPADKSSISNLAQQMQQQDATFIDVGAYSSRSGAADVDEQEEIERLRQGLPLIRSAAPQVQISVDTFRAKVARIAVEELGADIINDISAGQLDSEMFDTVARLRVPYIMMHMRSTPQQMQQHLDYSDLIGELFTYFSRKINQLHELGVNDIIIDPGFGFAKSQEQNYELLERMNELSELGQPILAGLSRKSMIYKPLGVASDQALNGTTALNMVALERGARILRVHDVKEALQTITLFKQLSKEHVETDLL